VTACVTIIGVVKNRNNVKRPINGLNRRETSKNEKSPLMTFQHR
jgi:hypothetical protein